MKKQHAKPRIKSRKPIRAANPKAQGNVDIKRGRFNPIAKALAAQQMAIRHPSLTVNIDERVKLALVAMCRSMKSLENRISDKYPYRTCP